MKKIFFNVFSVIILFFPLVPSFSENDGNSINEPLVQEVFIGDVVYPADKNEIQFTTMPQFQDHSGINTEIFPVFLGYGLTDKWQVGLSWNAYEIKTPVISPSVRGISDFVISTEYSFMHMNNSTYSTAFGLSVQFPSGNLNKGLTEGFVEYSPYAIIDKSFPSFFYSEIYTEVGMNLVSRAKSNIDNVVNPAAHKFFLNTGLIIPYKSLRGVFELNWMTNEWNHGGNDNELYFTPGLICHPNKSIELGLGVPIGLTKFSDHFQVIGMLTYSKS